MGKKEKKEKETINNRVKVVRKALKMNQAEFAERIGLSDSALSRIEIGNNSLTNHNILLVCTPNRLKENHTVNENWLRTGQGEMFIAPSAADGRPKLFDDNGKELPPDEEELIGVYRELIPENKVSLREDADKILRIQKNTEARLSGKLVDAVEKEGKGRRADTVKKPN